MEPPDVQSKLISPHLYTLIALLMGLGAVMMASSSILNQPNLDVLRPFGILAVSGGVPAIAILRRLENGTLTGGLLLIIMALYALMGAAFGIAVYADINGL